MIWRFPENNKLYIMNQDREGYEYHLTLLSVRMRVKFPCKMKVEYQGNLMTAEIPSTNNENRYIFNQEIVLRNERAQTECFEFVLHLVTDKGARYIGGVVKLYHSQLIRSQGEKLALSLTKCVDSEAFCEVRVNRIATLKDSRNTPYDRKSSVQRNVPSFRPRQESELSPFRNTLLVPNQQSRSQYNFPMYQSNQKQDEWDNRTKVRYPPPSNHSRIKTPSKYTVEPIRFMEESEAFVSRDRNLESEAYKEGYQKLKEKYKKEAEINKQELNRRLALENNENNLKLEVMRLKLRLEQQEKMLNQKTIKLKQHQNSLSVFKQKQGENNYLLEELKQRESTIEAQTNAIASLTADLTSLKELTRNRSTEDNYKVRELRVEIDNLKIKLQNKDKELEQETKSKRDLIAQKDYQLAMKQQQLERNKKVINDLEKGIQVKNYDLEKMLQNDRTTNKNKMDQLKAKVDKLEREALTFNEQKRQLNKKIQELKAVNIKFQYEKKLINQEYEYLQQQSNSNKNLKEKVNQLQRENKNLDQDRISLEHQVQKLIQQKQERVLALTQQLKDQTEHYKAIIKDMEEKQRKRASQMAQSESQLQQAKSQLEKQRKNIESLTRQLEECKQREKNAKKAVKNKEQESLGIETEHATLKQKLKTIDQIYKLEADKIREEADKYRIQLQQNNKKLAEIQTAYDQLTQQHAKVRTKLLYAEERSQRDSNGLKEKQTQFENYIKDSQQQITDLEKTIATLRASEKQLTNKLQRIQVDCMRKDERFEKAKRDLRVFQEKCTNYESTIKSRNSEIETLSGEKQVAEAKFGEKELQLNQLRSDYLTIVTEKNKLSKINELIEENFQKSKQEIRKSLQVIEQKQRQEAELINASKTEKQEYLKLEFSHNSLKKESQRNKELLYQNIQKYILPLIPGKEEELGKTNEKSPKKSKESNFTQICNLLVAYGKELKQIVTKLNDENKQLLREKERLQQNNSSLSNRLQDAQSSLNAQITQLSQQLQELYETKETEKNNFTIIVNELNEKLKEKEYLEEELHTQIQQLNFTINSIKLDSQALNETNTKRMATLRKINLEWQEKTEHLLLVTTDLQEKNTQLTEQIEMLQAEILAEQEQTIKIQKINAELASLRLQNQASIENLKKRNKEITQKLSDCELYLSSQKQINQKLRQSLESEQRNSAELKAFISQLMRQKQAAIKSDLEKNESITTLESTFLDLTKNNELLQEDNHRITKALQAQKETNKKITSTLKQAEDQLREEKINHSKTQQKLRQREKQSINKQQLIKRLQQKIEKTSEKFMAELRQAREQLQQKNKITSAESKDSNEKMIALQEQLQKKALLIANLQQKANHFEEQLFRLNEKYLQSEDATHVLRGQNEELKLKNNLLDQHINELSDEIKEREQKLFEYSGKNYTLQLKLQAKESQNKYKIEDISANWNNKFETACQEYEQRLELIQKQKDYFKALSQERDREVAKMINTLRSAEQADNQSRKNFEDKTRRQEEEKLIIVASKNSEIQKCSEEIRSLSDSLKSKESELRRTFNELQIAKKSVTSYETKARQTEEKAKSAAKLYQTEVEQLRKRDAAGKAFRENISNHLWNCEREAKKSIQSFVRAFLQAGEERSPQKTIELARNLETAILSAISFAVPEK